MKITCPKNKDHKTFAVTAHVTEGWIVDEDALFVAIAHDDREVVRKPSMDDLYTCVQCDAEAKTEN